MFVTSTEVEGKNSASVSKRKYCYQTLALIRLSAVTHFPGFQNKAPDGGEPDMIFVNSSNSNGIYLCHRHTYVDGMTERLRCRTSLSTLSDSRYGKGPSKGCPNVAEVEQPLKYRMPGRDIQLRSRKRPPAEVR